MLSLELLAAPTGSRLDHFFLNVDCLTIFLETTAATASCPLCGSLARRVHSRYTRRLADLPCFGRAVEVRITVRRFFCTELECPRRIFAERLPGFAAPYSRTTSRLHNAHEAIGSALGGEPGSRLTVRLAIATSPDTLLRRVKQLEGESAAPPRVVGIDDWAWRKGRRYGTIVVDLERGDVIDLLPDRDTTTVKKWLDEHPGVELISRDRSSSYAQAATESAPKAQQVADRWHLLKNLREAIERLFERQSDVVIEALKAPATATESPCSPALADAVQGVVAVKPSSPPQPLIEPPSESPRLQAQQARRRRRIERFEQVHERYRQGHSARRIARDLRMSRNVVRRYLRVQRASGLEAGTGMALPMGRAPRMDRRPCCRGLYKRGRPAPAIGDERFPRFVLQRAALRQDADGLGGEEARARRSSEAICSASSITEAVVVRMGPSARRSQAQ